MTRPFLLAPLRTSSLSPRANRLTVALARAWPALACLGTPALTWAQAASQEALPAITVQAESLPAWQAAAQAAEARAQTALDLRAGGTSLARRSDYASGPSRNLADVMAYTPGVAVNTRHGDETRFSIRGSGLQRGFLLRGIQLYQDGVPLNHADGAGDFQALDPLAAQYVQVWRGANALEYGANALGGAVNFVSPTGRTAAPASLRLQAGSFGAWQAQGAFAFQNESADGYLSATRSLQDGWREQSGTQATRIQGNLGYRINPELEARLFLSRVQSRLQMPGSLTRAAYDASPRQAAANYVRLNTVNNYDMSRVAARLSWTPSDALQWTTTVHASDRQRFHAMVHGVLENDFSDTGLDTRVVANLGSAALPRRWVAGLSVQRMHGDQTNSTNNLGRPGTRTGASTQTAKQSLLYAEYTHGLAPGLALQAGAQAVRSTRDYEDRLRPAGSYERRFDGFSPKLGVLYDLAPASQLYANLSRGFEAPPFGELVLRSSYPMAWAQKATTLEMGYRHRADALTLDATVYRSRIRGELLALSDSYGVALGTVNADRTTHQGVELAAQWAVGPGSQWRINYLYNDFRFDGDAVYGDRRLAGIAPHLLNLEYRWQPSAAFWIAPALEVRGGKTWIDHANTVSTGGFALLNVGVGGAIHRHLDWFVQGRNLGNRKYVASTAVQADVKGRDGGYYFPGDRRSVYAGLEWRLR